MRLPSTLIAVALVSCSSAPLAAQISALPLPYGTILEVVADGKVTRAPDMATVNAGVVTQASTAEQALLDNGRQMSRVFAALKAVGIADRDIRSANTSLQPQYRNAENAAPVITGYQATNSLSVRIREITRAGSILDTLVRQGVNQIDGPTFLIDKLEPALDGARADAMAKARTRADLYARLAGMRIDRVLSISESLAANVPLPFAPPAASAGRASDASTRMTPGEQEVTTSLTVRYLLK